MFRIKNCAYNLRGIGSRHDQPAPNTSSKHRSFLYIACRLWNNLPSHVREAPNLKIFLRQLKKVKLSQDLWFLLWLDVIVADSINSLFVFFFELTSLFYIFLAYSYCRYTYIFVTSLFLRLINVTCPNRVFQFQFQLLTLKQTLLCFCVSFYIVVMLNSDLVMIDPRKEFTWCQSKLYNMKDRLCSNVPPTKYNFLKIYSQLCKGCILLISFCFY